MINDPVNHPSHYTSGPFECILLTERYAGNLSNAIKYAYRHGNKNPGREGKNVEDLRKGLFYIRRAFGNGETFKTADTRNNAAIDAQTYRRLLQLADLDYGGGRALWLALADCETNIDAREKAVRAYERMVEKAEEEEARK